MAIVFDASSQAIGGSATTASWTHVCTGANRCLYAAISLDGAGTPAATATYNGVSMTKLAELAGQQGLVMFRLVNPAAGSFTIQFNWTGAFVWASAAMSFTGVDQTTPDAGTAAISEAATGTSVSNNVTSAAGNIVVDSLSLNAGTAATMTAGAGQTTNAVKSEAAASATLCCMSYEDGAPTTTMSWSWTSGTNRNTHARLSVNAAAGGAVRAPYTRPFPYKPGSSTLRGF